MKENLKMQAPWEVFARELEALFAKDPAVAVETDFGGEKPAIRLRVEGADKADAIARLLPGSVTFGGVEVALLVVPSNAEPSPETILRRAFAGNGAFVDAVTLAPAPGAPALVHAVFAPEVVQFWCDNLAHPSGIVTTLYESIARDVLTGAGAQGVLHCTKKVAQ